MEPIHPAKFTAPDDHGEWAAECHRQANNSRRGTPPHSGLMLQQVRWQQPATTISIIRTILPLHQLITSFRVRIACIFTWHATEQVIAIWFLFKLLKTFKTECMNVTLEQAEAVIKAAKAKAKELKTLMNIAVVDRGTNLVAFAHMDNAWIGSIDISQKKARTARYFNMPTGEIGKLSQPGGPLYNIEHSNGGLISFPGGVLIKNAGGDIIGAVGVSGDTVENDHIVAQAGADAVK